MKITAALTYLTSRSSVAGIDEDVERIIVNAMAPKDFPRGATIIMQVSPTNASATGDYLVVAKPGLAMRHSTLCGLLAGISISTAGIALPTASMLHFTVRALPPFHVPGRRVTLVTSTTSSPAAPATSLSTGGWYCRRARAWASASWPSCTTPPAQRR